MYQSDSALCPQQYRTYFYNTPNSPPTSQNQSAKMNPIVLDFDKQYQKCLKAIMTSGIEEVNERTGHATRSLPGLQVQVDMEKSFPALTLRKIPLKIFTAEQVWFVMGSRRPADFIKKHTMIWDDFTNYGGVVTVAYGFRMRHHFGRDQLGKLIELLTEQPSSRHGVVVFWDPADDGLGSRAKKNVPCPYSFTVNIIGGRLHMHLIVRSNDMILGFPHDAGGFSMLAYLLAEKLGVKPGMYTHSISNAHVYDIHYDAANEMIKRKSNHKPIKFKAKKNYFDRAEKGDHTLVEEILGQIEPQYKPGEPIKGLKIVL